MYITTATRFSSHTFAGPPCICNDIVGAAECKQLLCKARHERSGKITPKTIQRPSRRVSSRKRILKQKFEERVETVRNFWRNQIVEGRSRASDYATLIYARVHAQHHNPHDRFLNISSTRGKCLRSQLARERWVFSAQYLPGMVRKTPND